MIRPLIAGNWKMFKTILESLDYVERLKEAIRDVRDRDVVIAPPFTSLYPVGGVLKGSNIRLAAQNLSDRTEGACTGEISARMLADCGCTHVIVGHSERRTLFGEQDATIGAKLRAAIRSGLHLYLSVFLAATLADWATYLVTAAQLALAFPAASGGVYASFEAFAAVFAITQVPLAAVEGAVTALMFKYIVQLRSDVLVRMNVVSEKAVARLREAAA